ncbi:hypothetical protein [Methylocystis sp. ATCC 49242]|uniref:hypothetical protein n=1 Tax=Methylocystis sp. ATCC 49242 TaxID=622637 RepID=UPI003529C59C
MFGERHLRHVLLSYMAYYNDARTHLSLNKDAPIPRHSGCRTHCSHTNSRRTTPPICPDLISDKDRAASAEHYWPVEPWATFHPLSLELLLEAVSECSCRRKHDVNPPRFESGPEVTRVGSHCPWLVPIGPTPCQAFSLVVMMQSDCDNCAHDKLSHWPRDAREAISAGTHSLPTIT